MKKFPVIEIFGPTIQGEGVLIGKRSHFIRFGGCGYRCIWCDSMHAVDPKQIKANATMMTGHEIQSRIASLQSSPWITLSGGDPVMWDLTELVEGTFNKTWSIAVETQGQHFRPWLRFTELITISPKGPSSGMYEKTDWNVLNKYVETFEAPQHRGAGYPKIVFKVVIFDEDDLMFVKEIMARYPQVPMYLSVGTPSHDDLGDAAHSEVVGDILEGLYQISEAILGDRAFSKVTLLPQQHVLTWGHKKGV